MIRTYDEKNALELLKSLVEIDSVNPVYGGPGEGELADFVENWLETRGIASHRQPVLPGRDNIYCRIGPRDAPALLLEAHMDTVGVEGWKTGDPHELRVEGNRFYGRGSCDTKGSLACFLLTLERFAREPEKLNRALVFAASVDEESKQIGAVELAKLSESLKIKWAITGEPTRSDVIARHKGFGRYLVSVTGKAAHASTPDLGENAVYKGARLCQKFEEHAAELRCKPADGEIELGTLNVGAIRGGVGFNIVPDLCQIDLDRRLGRFESAEAARESLQRICSSETGVGFEVFLERPPLRGEDSDLLVSDMISAAKRVGHMISEREVPYMTNAVAYESVGVPALVFGPGDIAQAHKSDEYIEAGEVVRSVEILESLLLR
ncbi:M20 family metallopeptidase [Pelagicoccus albus]|uniref:M20 family metallopeptidase n=1 Tax=Pelagicoccus albus TaxID=415222 RepID=A0A7X1B4C6_9BACT|nr:M20 family metallopeptidase [Pelagicoccus albus]MBC2605408.1 M20 family metallopeptidase [Pelagicoccus albus]